MKACRAMLRFAGWLALFALVTAISVLRTQGCRTPPPIVFESRNPYGIFFDADPWPSMPTRLLHAAGD
jgi:hypothetical protein